MSYFWKINIQHNTKHYYKNFKQVNESLNLKTLEQNGIFRFIVKFTRIDLIAYVSFIKKKNMHFLQKLFTDTETISHLIKISNDTEFYENFYKKYNENCGYMGNGYYVEPDFSYYKKTYEYDYAFSKFEFSKLEHLRIRCRAPKINWACSPLDHVLRVYEMCEDDKTIPEFYVPREKYNERKKHLDYSQFTL